MKLSTSDLYESGYFLSEGAALLEARMERRRRPTVVFDFEDGRNHESLDRLQDAYHNGAAQINLAVYRGNLEILKDIMFRKIKELDALARREELNQEIHESRFSESRKGAKTF